MSDNSRKGNSGNISDELRMIKSTEELLKILKNLKAEIPTIIEESIKNKAQTREKAMEQIAQSKSDFTAISNYMKEMIEQIELNPQQFVEKMKENQNDIRKSFDQVTMEAQNNFRKFIGKMEMENPAIDMLSRFDPNALREKMIERIQQEL